MKNLVLIFVFICTVMYANAAKAGILLEPYAGMLVNSKTSDDENLSGTLYGAKLGWYSLGLNFGLDTRMGKISVDSDTNDEVTFNKSYGLFVGYDFPVMFRIWATYIFSEEQELASDDTQSDGAKLIDMVGTRFGFGYKIIPMVSLNLEYSKTSTDKFEINGTEFTTSETEYWLLSVSLPLTF